MRTNRRVKEGFSRLDDGGMHEKPKLSRNDCFHYAIDGNVSSWNRSVQIREPGGNAFRDSGTAERVCYK